MNTIKVLDHGSVTLRNIAGPTRRLQNPNEVDGSFGGRRAFDADDTDIANAARLSFEGQDQERDYNAEMKLTRYLLKNGHMTPFESIVVWLEMKLPIFVARQFVRHRTQSINEASGRYIKLPGEWYIPATVMKAPTDKKQGAAGPVDPLMNDAFRNDLDDQCRESYRLYESYLKDGVAPEQARLFLHVNHYTHWMTKFDLRNLLNFLSLRDHSHAQYEAQVYAKAVTELLEPHLPGIMALYREIIRGEAA